MLGALGERLTNGEIGGRLFLSVRTVETYVSALLRKFNAGNRRELAEIAQQYRGVIPRRVGRPLPSHLTVLIGRDNDIDAIADRLEGCRLLTLTGPAGVGKTRLALEVAARVGRVFDGGAVFIDLTAAADEATVAAAFVGALDATTDASQGTREGLLRLLAAAGPVLLVVDNCEHVLGSVSELLVCAVGMNEALVVLATSREALTVPGEQVFAGRAAR